MPDTSPGLSGGVTQNKRTWYLDQGQTQITFNYKHSHNGYSRNSRNLLWGQNVQTNHRMTSVTSTKTVFAHFELPLCLPDTSSCNARGRQAEVFL